MKFNGIATLITNNCIPYTNGNQCINEFYDFAKKMCCKEWLCGSLRSVNSIKSQSIRDLPFEQFKLLPLKSMISILILIIAVLITFFYWEKLAIRVKIGNEKPKNLRTWKTFFMYLNFPRAFPTLIIASWYSFFFLLSDQVIQYLWPSPLHATPSDFIALSVAGTAILFPLIILIMDGTQEGHSGVFPRSEVLLRHAFAFPISVILLTTLALSAFQMNFYWMRLVVVISIFLSAVALLRLLHVIFGPKAWRKTEEVLLKGQTQDAIKEIAHQRSGFINTAKIIKELDPYVTTYFGSFEQDNFIEHKIKAGEEGRIKDVDVQILNGIIMKLAPEKENAEQQSSEELATTESKPASKKDFQIIIKTFIGDVIEQPNEVIGAFRYKKESFNEKEVKFATSSLKKSIIIDPLAETDHSTELLDVLLSRLRLLGMEAIDKDNEALTDRISSTYRLLVDAVLDAFEELGIKYTLGNAKQENSLFGKDWKPLTRMFQNIGDWTEYMLKHKTASHTLKATIVYTPYRLAITSYSKRDIFTFSSSLRLAISQQNFDANEENMPYEWLKSLADYSICGDLEEASGNEEERKIILEYLRALFEVELILAKNAIDSGNYGAFQATLDLFNQHPRIFQHEYFDSEIELQESYLNIVQEDADKEAIRAKLVELQSKQSLKEKINNWRKELLVGLAAYSLMQIDGAGKQLKTPPTEDFLKKVFLLILNHLSNNFVENITLRVHMNRYDVSERWGWEWWEHITPGEAKFMSFSTYLDRVFSFLILRSEIQDIDYDALNRLQLHDKDVIDFRDDPQALRGRIKEINLQMPRFGFDEKDENGLKDISEAFEKICSTAKLNSDLKIVGQKISSSRITNFIHGFQSTFLKNNRFRSLLQFNRIPTQDDKNRLKWGLNILIQREYFIENPEYGHPSFGEHYGSDLGRSEEGLIYQSIAEKTELTQAKNISELISNALSNDFSISSMVILCSKNIYSMKALKGDPLFKYSHQVKSEQHKSKADGYIDWSGHLIPVFSIFAKANKLDNLANLLIIDVNAIMVEQRVDINQSGYMPEVGVTLKIVDPLEENPESIKLKKDLFTRNPDWLKNSPSEHKEQLVGKLIWLRALEDLEVIVKKVPVGIITSSED